MNVEVLNLQKNKKKIEMESLFDRYNSILKNLLKDMRGDTINLIKDKEGILIPFEGVVSGVMGTSYVDYDGCVLSDPYELHGIVYEDKSVFFNTFNVNSETWCEMNEDNLKLTHKDWLLIILQIQNLKKGEENG
jgi:hypothetical protein